TFNRLTIDGSGVKTISGNVVVNGVLSFADGMLATGANNLTLGASANITGAGAASFIITGNTGSVKKLGLGNGGSTGDFVFPVGVAASSYTPATVSNTGTMDNFTLRLLDNVYSAYAGNTPNGTAITSMVVNRTWFVEEDVQGGSNVTLTLQWNAGEETPLFVRGMSYVAHNTGTAWLAGPTANASAGSETASYTRTWAGITYFSPFGVGSTGSALPVKLISFKGYPQGNGNKLEWTASLEQLQRYEVERSGSQAGFVRIGEVRALGGTATLSYNWVDASPLSGANFYRLRMIHPDGKATYSDVVSINRGTGVPTVAVYPTPVAGRALSLQLTNLEKGAYMLRLYNGAGQSVFTRTLQHNGGSSLEPLPLPATLARGAYTLQLTKGDQRFTNSIIIQ
ncbi:MAG: T9SS type A sorting domain-containing protein, partial [Chitinophagaceae bacterium]